MRTEFDCGGNGAYSGGRPRRGQSGAGTPHVRPSRRGWRRCNRAVNRQSVQGVNRSARWKWWSGGVEETNNQFKCGNATYKLASKFIGEGGVVRLELLLAVGLGLGQEDGGEGLARRRKSRVVNTGDLGAESCGANGWEY